MCWWLICLSEQIHFLKSKLAYRCLDNWGPNVSIIHAKSNCVLYINCNEYPTVFTHVYSKGSSIPWSRKNYDLLYTYNYYVKALLWLIYRKYNRRDGVKWQIQHEAKLSAVFAWDPTQSTVFFCTSWVNNAVTDLLFCVGRISSSSSNGCRWIYISK